MKLHTTIQETEDLQAEQWNVTLTTEELQAILMAGMNFDVQKDLERRGLDKAMDALHYGIRQEVWPLRTELQD